MRFHVECVTPARIGGFFYTPRYSKQPLLSLRKTFKSSSGFYEDFYPHLPAFRSFFFLRMFSHFSQCSNPEICVTFFTDATAGIHSLNSERKNSLRRFFLSGERTRTVVQWSRTLEKVSFPDRVLVI